MLHVLLEWMQKSVSPGEIIVEKLKLVELSATMRFLSRW
jgi:hypothetical protein